MAYNMNNDDMKLPAITWPGSLEASDSLWGGISLIGKCPDNTEHVGSDEDREIFCDPCELDRQKNLAERYCKNCSEFLCITCCTHHRRYRPTRHHILLDKDEMPTVRNVNTPKDMCTEICAHHEHNVIEYYCRSCNKFGCSHCFVVGHRNCTVSPIQDLATGLENSAEFNSFKDQLAKLKSRLKTTEKKFHFNKSEVDILQDRAKTEIRKHRNAINAFFDKLEGQVDKTVDKIRRDDAEVMDDIDKRHELIASECQAKLSDFESKEKLGQKCQLFVDLATSGGRLQELEEKMTELNEKNKIKRYEILMSEEILDMIENLKSLSVLFEKYSVWKRKPMFCGKICMNARSDRNDCEITGICLLNSNQLFVVDVNNMCVKLVDLASSGNKIVCVVPMPSWPWDVTKVTATEVAITLPITGQIRFLSKSNNDASPVFTSRFIDVGLECRGIEYSKGNLIVSFTTDPGMLRILSLTGKVLRVFSTGLDGQQLFGQPNYLALGLDHNIIYVSDSEKHTVTSLDRCGNVKDVYRNDDLRCPNGMAVDRVDSLFVCGSRYFNVHQLYSDLSHVQILLDHSNAEEKPQCMAYCRNTNRLFIGIQNGDSINMFKLM